LINRSRVDLHILICFPIFDFTHRKCICHPPEVHLRGVTRAFVTPLRSGRGGVGADIVEGVSLSGNISICKGGGAPFSDKKHEIRCLLVHNCIHRY